MINAQAKPDLELIEDLQFEAREWKLQRVAWLLMAVVIALGILGLFGAGPISSRTVTSHDGGLTLKYNRFERYQAPSSLRMEVISLDTSEARIWINRDFMRTVKVQAVVPPPKRVQPQNNGMVYTFDTPGKDSLLVIFHLETEQIGSSPVRLRLNDGPILEAPHWVYP